MLAKCWSGVMSGSNIHVWLARCPLARCPRLTYAHHKYIKIAQLLVAKNVIFTFKDKVTVLLAALFTNKH